MKKETRKKLIACLTINSASSTPEELKKTFETLQKSSDDKLQLSKDLIQLIYKKELVEFDSSFQLVDFPSSDDWEKFVDDMGHRLKKSRKFIIKSGRYP